MWHIPQPRFSRRSLSGSVVIRNSTVRDTWGCGFFATSKGSHAAILLVENVHFDNVQRQAEGKHCFDNVQRQAEGKHLPGSDELHLPPTSRELRRSNRSRRDLELMLRDRWHSFR